MSMLSWVHHRRSMQPATRVMTLFGFGERMGRLKRMQSYSVLFLRRLYALRKFPKVILGRNVMLMVFARAPESQRMVKSFPSVLDYAQRIHRRYFPEFSSWE